MVFCVLVLPMSRRANFDARCDRCRMHDSLCICALIPTIETRTRLVLLIHRREDRKTTNTGRLATLCLPNSEVVVRGEIDERTTPFVPDPARQPVLLYPSDDAVPLADFAASERPITLLVPDGTWRQASKVKNRVPGLAELPCVSLPPGPTTVYRLRHETRDGGLATFEAIARAMGVLEGPDVRATMERVFLAMVERTLWSRGVMDAGKVAAGIPEGTQRHLPRG